MEKMENVGFAEGMKIDTEFTENTENTEKEKERILSKDI